MPPSSSASAASCQARSKSSCGVCDRTSGHAHSTRRAAADACRRDPIAASSSAKLVKRRRRCSRATAAGASSAAGSDGGFTRPSCWRTTSRSTATRSTRSRRPWTQSEYPLIKSTTGEDDWASRGLAVAAKPSQRQRSRRRRRGICGVYSRRQCRPPPGNRHSRTRRSPMIVRAVRLFLAVAVAMCAAAGVLVTSVGARPQGQQKVALVTVVADANGPIKDLTAKDFIVTEDNAKREVVAAQLADDPLSVALLIDTTQPPVGSTPPVQDLRTAVTTFVRTVQAGSPGAKISLSEIAGA